VIEVLAVRVEEGQLSPQLHSLNTNDVIEVSTKAAGFMILDELAQDSCYQHLWFLATGTGVGPFISMMRTQAPWDKYQKVILAYGVRHVSDLAYLDTLEKLEQTYPNQFVFIPLVTRESYSRGLDCRIPEGIASGRLEALAKVNLAPNNTQVMICGNPDMVAEAQKLLDEKGLVKHLRRAPGQVTVEKYW
jgi:ferredoxin--NADP+ reductase